MTELQTIGREWQGLIEGTLLAGNPVGNLLTKSLNFKDILEERLDQDPTDTELALELLHLSRRNHQLSEDPEHLMDEINSHTVMNLLRTAAINLATRDREYINFATANSLPAHEPETLLRYGYELQTTPDTQAPLITRICQIETDHINHNRQIMAQAAGNIHNAVKLSGRPEIQMYQQHINHLLKDQRLTSPVAAGMLYHLSELNNDSGLQRGIRRYLKTAYHKRDAALRELLEWPGLINNVLQTISLGSPREQRVRLCSEAMLAQWLREYETLSNSSTASCQYKAHSGLKHQASPQEAAHRWLQAILQLSPADDLQTWGQCAGELVARICQDDPLNEPRLRMTLQTHLPNAATIAQACLKRITQTTAPLTLSPAIPVDWSWYQEPEYDADNSHWDPRWVTEYLRE